MTQGPQSVPARIRADRGIEPDVFLPEGVACPGESEGQPGAGQRQGDHHRLLPLLQVEEYPYEGGQFVQHRRRSLAKSIIPTVAIAIVYLKISVNSHNPTVWIKLKVKNKNNKCSVKKTNIFAIDNG